MTVNGLEGSILFGPNWSGKVGNCIVWGMVWVLTDNVSRYSMVRCGIVGFVHKVQCGMVAMRKNGHEWPRRIHSALFALF